jgi:hypothetical protein
MDFMMPNNFGAVSLLDKWIGSVAVSTIDSFGITQCDFMKIDVEGMELHVLQGAENTIEKFRPVIAVEADREETIESIFTWLIEHDYHVLVHEPFLGELWPNIASRNFLAIPNGREYDIAKLPKCTELQVIESTRT